jgi:shikimate kinase
MITYDWNCKTVDVYPQEEGETNVVYNVHWRVTGVKEDYSATNIGTQIVTLNPETEFIPFDELTNEVVVGWTKEAMSEEQVEAIEGSIASQIDELENPASVTMTIED